MDEELEGQGTETGEVTEPVAQSEVVEETESGGGNKINPAWNDLLGVVPSQLHSQVTPFLSQWDKNYQEGLQKVHSQYEPYKEYLDQYKPEDIDYALKVIAAIENDPKAVAKALSEYAGEKSEETPPEQQGQVNENEDEDDPILNHPKFKEVSKMVETMAQLLVQQNQTQAEIEEDKALAKELEELKTSVGDFEEEWVLSRAAANPEIPLKEHVEAYIAHEKKILEKARKPGPKVMNGGGSAPNNQLDIKSLPDKDRRALIVQQLQAAAQQKDA